MESRQDEKDYYERKLEYLKKHCVTLCEFITESTDHNSVYQKYRDAVAELEKIKTSPSWKVTKPLRDIMRLIKQVLRMNMARPFGS